MFDFPVNKGTLCPKGVKRYLQNSHPDRLLHAYARNPAAAGGFTALPYQEAIQRVAKEIDRIQTTYGPQAMGMIGGASLTTEKAYLVGKFARMCLKTPFVDYNGRLCMVSAAAANKKAFGVDRAANPWADIPKSELIWISGANVGECFPILTNYLWAARDKGARIVIVDPRITPVARTCDLFLPVKPGRDIALFNGVLHLMIEKGWIDYDFVERSTVGFEKGNFNFLEVLDAQRTYFAAQSQYLKALAEAHRAASDIDRVLGEFGATASQPANKE